jgi:hypothetical protein
MTHSVPLFCHIGPHSFLDICQGNHFHTNLPHKSYNGKGVRQCDCSTGQCTNGCQPGWYGVNCECSTPNINCNEFGCNKTTRTCNICKIGFHGDSCDLKCPEKCGSDILQPEMSHPIGHSVEQFAEKYPVVHPMHAPVFLSQRVW